MIIHLQLSALHASQAGQATAGQQTMLVGQQAPSVPQTTCWRAGANRCKFQGQNMTNFATTKATMYHRSQLNLLNSKACKSGFNDPEELLPLCYKCSNYSQHLNNNTCPTCRQDYIFSFVSFGEFAPVHSINFLLTYLFTEILPLVQFYPEVDIPDAEAERLLLAPTKNADDADPFNEDVASALPLSLDRNALRAIDPNHVLILKRHDKHIRNIYYRNILPDLQVTYCSECLLVRLS